jgi:hypothetical protein
MIIDEDQSFSSCALMAKNMRESVPNPASGIACSASSRTGVPILGGVWSDSIADGAPHLTFNDYKILSNEQVLIIFFYKKVLRGKK